jgi:DNA-binding MarR family transcriptional regulator
MSDKWEPDETFFPRPPSRDDRPPFDLAGYVPYLLNRAGSRIAEAFGEVTKREGLSLGMWRVLAALDACEPQTVTELARATAIEVSTLSRMLEQMERKLLVRRERGFGDKRAVMVFASGYGRLLTERLVPVALAFEAAATAGFNDAEKATLQGLLRRLYDNLDGIDRVRVERLNRAG